MTLREAQNDPTIRVLSPTMAVHVMHPVFYNGNSLQCIPIPFSLNTEEQESTYNAAEDARYAAADAHREQLTKERRAAAEVRWNYRAEHGQLRLPIPEPWRERLILAAHGHCPYCRKELVDGLIQIDHKIPIDRAPDFPGFNVNSFSNMHACCAPCNLQKHTMTDSEYRAYLIARKSRSRFAAFHPARVASPYHSGRSRT